MSGRECIHNQSPDRTPAIFHELGYLSIDQGERESYTRDILFHYEQ